MPKETLHGDSLHEALLKIFSDNYIHTSISRTPSDVVPDVNQFLTESSSWNEDREWPPSIQDDATGVPNIEYRRAMINAIGETLNNLVKAIAASEIFTEEEKSLENGEYQDLMRVLATPESLSPISMEPSDMEGLLIRDFTFNKLYWKDPGAHIRLMRNLSGVLEKIFAIRNTAEGTQKAKQALKEMFPMNKSFYGLCPAEQSYRIKSAKNLLATEPKETLVAYWNLYVQEIMKEAPEEGTPSISERIQQGNQLHFPFFADRIFGVSPDLIEAHDKSFGSGIIGLDNDCLSMVIERCFDFPRWLVTNLDNSIEDIMRGFDQLEDLSEQNRAVYHIERDILTPWRGLDNKEGFMNDVFVFEEDGKDSRFEKSDTIIKKAKEIVAGSICEMTGFEQVSLKALSKLEVSLEKRLECIPIGERSIIWLLLSYENKNDDSASFKTIMDACPKTNRTGVVSHALYNFANKGNVQAMERLFNICPEPIRNQVMADTLLKCSELEHLEPLKHAMQICPETNRTGVVSHVLYNFANKGDVQAMKRLFNICPEPIRNRVMADTLLKCSKLENLEPLKHAMQVCPETNRTGVISHVLYNFANKGDVQAMERLFNICPEPIRNLVMADTLLKCSKLENLDPLKHAMQVCPETNRTGVISHVLYSFANKGNVQAMERLFNICPEPIRNQVMADTLLKCSKLENLDPLKHAMQVCPETNRTGVISHVLYSFANKGNVQAMERLFNICPEPIRNQVMADTLLKCSKLENLDPLKHAMQVCPETNRTVVVSHVLYSFANKGNVQAMERLFNICPEPIRNQVMADTLLKCSKLENLDPLKHAMQVCPETNRTGVVSHVLYSFANKGNVQAMERLFNICPEPTRHQVIVNTLFKCSKLEHLESLKHAMQICPETNRTGVISQVLYSLANKGDVQAMERLFKSCPDPSLNAKVAGTVLYNFAKRTDHLGTQGIEKVLQACQGALKEQSIAMGLAACRMRKEDQVKERILKACTEPLKKKVLKLESDLMQRKPSLYQNVKISSVPQESRPDLSALTRLTPHTARAQASSDHTKKESVHKRKQDENKGQVRDGKPDLKPPPKKSKKR
ncbi:hypothetical protein [Ascidiimonas sp. W6]|uniref:hypothetical protein n=1 Tax=Ascidiimonas meishanensis TaxID=3128903 RepID=UPI0030EBA9A0